MRLLTYSLDVKQCRKVVNTSYKEQTRWCMKYDYRGHMQAPWIDASILNELETSPDTPCRRQLARYGIVGHGIACWKSLKKGAQPRSHTKHRHLVPLMLKLVVS